MANDIFDNKIMFSIEKQQQKSFFLIKIRLLLKNDLILEPFKKKMKKIFIEKPKQKKDGQQDDGKNPRINFPADI